MRVSPWLALGLLAVAVAACDFDGRGTTIDSGNPPIDALDAPDTPGDDGDNDGVRDGDDNCPTVANTDQHDEDADGVGDKCDNCPTVANPAQANQGESAVGQAVDQAGDACDPFPDRPGNNLLFFDSFASRDPLWQIAPGGGVWSWSGDAVTQTDPDAIAYLYYAGDLHGDVVVDITARIVTVPNHGFGIGSTAQWNLSPGDGAGYLCQLFDTPAGPGDGPLNIGAFLLQSTVAPQVLASQLHTSITPEVTSADAWTVRHAAIASARSCSAASSAGFRVTTATVANSAVPTGRWGLRAALAHMRFENIVVYTVGS